MKTNHVFDDRDRNIVKAPTGSFLLLWEESIDFKTLSCQLFSQLSGHHKVAFSPCSSATLNNKAVLLIDYDAFSSVCLKISDIIWDKEIYKSKNFYNR